MASGRQQTGDGRRQECQHPTRRLPPSPPSPSDPKNAGDGRAHTGVQARNYRTPSPLAPSGQMAAPSMQQQARASSLQPQQAFFPPAGSSMLVSPRGPGASHSMHERGRAVPASPSGFAAQRWPSAPLPVSGQGGLPATPVPGARAVAEQRLGSTPPVPGSNRSSALQQVGAVQEIRALPDMSQQQQRSTFGTAPQLGMGEQQPAAHWSEQIPPYTGLLPVPPLRGSGARLPPAHLPPPPGRGAPWMV